jgi:hypothetical protein
MPQQRRGRALGPQSAHLHPASLNLLTPHPPQNEIRFEPVCSLPQPLLLLRGTDDPYSTPASWQLLRARLRSPSVRVTEIDGGNHWLRPEGKGAAAEAAAEAAVRAALQGFLQSLKAPAPAGAAGNATTAPRAAGAPPGAGAGAAAAAAARVPRPLLRPAAPAAPPRGGESPVKPPGLDRPLRRIEVNAS